MANRLALDVTFTRDVDCDVYRIHTCIAKRHLKVIDGLARGQA